MVDANPLSRFLLAILLASCMAPEGLPAAEIRSSQVAGQTAVIEISGAIELGDEEKFRAVAASYRDALIVLSSFGGRISPAFEIGKDIRVRGYDTIVAEQTVCASACALIWLAGKTKYATHTSRIGFHASSIADGNEVRETGMGNALVGRYLTLLGYSEAAVVYVTFAPPDQLLWLTDAPYDVSQIRYSSVASLSEVTAKQNNIGRDSEFRALFNAWKKVDQLQKATDAIPSARPLAASGLEGIVRGFKVGTDEYAPGKVAHRGVDIKANSEAPVYATADGVVSQSRKLQSGRMAIEIDHQKGIATRYWGLSVSVAKVGSMVKRGQLIGSAPKGKHGATHIHYEVLLDGKPVDPLPFLKADGELSVSQK